MFTAEIKVSKKNDAGSDPKQLTEFSLPDLQEVLSEVNAVIIVANRKKMLDGYNLAINISKDD